MVAPIDPQQVAASPALVHCLLLDGNGGAQSWPLAQLADAPEHQGVWIHLDYSQASEHEFKTLLEIAPIPAPVLDALCDEDSRPSVLMSNDQLLAMVRGVNNTPEGEPEDMVSLRLWCNRQTIITVRRRPLLSVAEVVQQLEQGIGPVSPLAIVIDVIDIMLDRIQRLLEDNEDQLLDLEDVLLDEQAVIDRTELTTLRRKVLLLRRYLAPQRDALLRLTTSTLSFCSSEQRYELRDLSETGARLVEALELIRDRANMIHETLLSRMQEQLNQRLYMLAIVSAIFLPISFVAGMLGINVGGIPGSDSPWGFLIVAALMGLALLGQLVWFKKRGWL